MSERLTSIGIPGRPMGEGLADYGRKSPAEMIAQYRRYAEGLKEQAEAILAASDEDFRIETYVGVHVMRNLEVIQAGKDTA